MTATADKPRARLVSSADIFCVVLLLAVAARLVFASALSGRGVSAWSTVFAAVCIQAAPFVALGVVVSTAIAVGVPDAVLARVLPARAGLSVPIAGVAGMLLPGCECGSVPIAASLMRRGVSAAPAVTFLLSAPSINPVVLVATAVAFRGHPGVVLARFLASLVTALVVGWLWQRAGRGIAPPARLTFAEHESAWTRVRLTASHDLCQSLGLLAIGAASTATLKISIPSSWLNHLAANEIVGVGVLSVLAIALAVCSEADAFIAVSLTQFSMTARLAFMVVGPAVDAKLIVMQLGTFGSAFTRRFAPLAFVVAVAAAVLIGWLIL